MSTTHLATPSHSQPPERDWIEKHRTMGLGDWIDAMIATWPAKTTPTALGAADRLRSIRTELGWTLGSWAAYRHLVEWFDGPWGRTEEERLEREMLVLDFLDAQPKNEIGGYPYPAPYNLGLHLAAFQASGLTRFPPKVAAVIEFTPEKRRRGGRQGELGMGH